MSEARDCKHGQLARSCEICERDARIKQLEEGYDVLRTALHKAERQGYLAGLDAAAKVCVEKGKHWQSMTPNLISPVGCAAADCADAILALKDAPDQS